MRDNEMAKFALTTDTDREAAIAKARSSKQLGGASENATRRDGNALPVLVSNLHALIIRPAMLHSLIRATLGAEGQRERFSICTDCREGSRMGHSKLTVPLCLTIQLCNNMSSVLDLNHCR